MKYTLKNHLINIRSLEQRNQEFLHLTANENQMSRTANSILSSKLSERYYFGGGEQNIIDWNPFTCLGLAQIEDLLTDAANTVKSMLKGKVINLNCLSGVHAMIAGILSTTHPGDTVMSVHYDDGGHVITKSLVESVGRKHVFAKFNLKQLNFDVKKTAAVFKKNNCKVLYLDCSYNINPINVTELRSALGNKAIIIYDASHTIGLMMGGEFQSPLEEGADIICANTHKTLPGPQKGMMIFKDKALGEAANSIISSSLISSSHTHHLIALAITILEMDLYGKDYAKQIIKNANALGKELHQRGYEVRALENNVYSTNHQIHVFLPEGINRSATYKNLVGNNISTNFDDRLGGKVFARIGVQEVTRRGMKENDMKSIATFYDKSVKGTFLQKEVVEFNNKFNSIFYSIY